MTNLHMQLSMLIFCTVVIWSDLLGGVQSWLLTIRWSTQQPNVGNDEQRLQNPKLCPENL